MKKTFFSLFKDKTALKSRDCDSISQFQAVSAALAAAMGTGNIAGVATAITLGGPGAIFWMWVSAIAGMALVYGENYLGTVYRRKKHGRWYGGPMAYLENGAGSKRLACLFAVFCAFAALGMGNMTQVNSISSALDGCFGIPPLATGIAAAVIAGIIISGGIKRIGSASQALIPFLSIVYIAVSAYAIICNIENVPGAFSLIFKEAFGIREVGGGISGAVISKSVNAGLRRGVFFQTRQDLEAQRCFTPPRTVIIRDSRECGLFSRYLRIRLYAARLRLSLFSQQAPRTAERTGFFLLRRRLAELPESEDFLRILLLRQWQCLLLRQL